jgi:hypothetical protein
LGLDGNSEGAFQGNFPASNISVYHFIAERDLENNIDQKASKIMIAPTEPIVVKIVNNTIVLLPTDLPVILRYRATRNQRKQSDINTFRDTNRFSLGLSGLNGTNRYTQRAKIKQ